MLQDLLAKYFISFSGTETILRGNKPERIFKFHFAVVVAAVVVTVINGPSQFFSALKCWVWVS